MQPVYMSCRSSDDPVFVVHDIDVCIRSWGVRGVLSGLLLGTMLGMVLTAIPRTESVLTFGTAGTLLVCAVVCSVITGAFGALAAALNGRGFVRVDLVRLRPIRVPGPRSIR